MLLCSFLEDKARQIFKRRKKKAARMENIVSGSRRSRCCTRAGESQAAGDGKGQGSALPNTASSHSTRPEEQSMDSKSAKQINRSGSAKTKGTART